MYFLVTRLAVHDGWVGRMNWLGRGAGWLFPVGLMQLVKSWTLASGVPRPAKTALKSMCSGDSGKIGAYEEAKMNISI